MEHLELADDIATSSRNAIRQLTVGLPLSMALQSPGDSPGAPVLVSTGIQLMAPLGEADLCLGMALRLCSSCKVLYCNVVYDPHPLLTKDEVIECITWQSCQVNFFQCFNVIEG